MKTTKRIRTIRLAGHELAIPDGMTDKELAAFCGVALQFRRVECVYPADYRKPFHYLDEYTEVARGTREVYESEDAAREVRDARNAEIKAAEEVKAEA